MPLRGYAEVSIGAAVPQRFLLDLDLSVLNTNAEPTATAVTNVVDVNRDGIADLRIALVLRRFSATETSIEIRLTPMPGQELRQANVWVFIDTNQDVVPVGTDTGPDSFVYFGYVGAVDEVTPTIRATVGRSTVTFHGAAGPTDVVTVSALLSTMVPRRIEVGQLKGPVVSANARRTTYSAAGVYAQGPEEPIRTAGPRPPLGTTPLVPDAMAASITITDPAMSDGSTLRVVILTAHTQGADAALPLPANRQDRPGIPTAPTVALAGAGAGQVTRGRHSYRVTYLLRNGNETVASAPSAVVDVADPTTDGRVRLTNVAVGAAPPASEPLLGVAARRIYRSLSSPSGAAGEYFRVGELAGNTSTVFEDNIADRPAGPSSLPGPKVPDALGVVVNASGNFDLDGVLHTRTAGVTDTYHATLQRIPKQVTVAMLTEPGAGNPRVRWEADSVLGSAHVSSPTLRGDVNRFFEARLRELPKDVGVDWVLEGSTRTRIEIGGAKLSSTLDVGIGDLAVVLAPAARAWRDAPQTACFELVERRSATNALTKARTRITARGVRRFRLALGEAGTHSRWDDGIVADVVLGPDRLAPGRLDDRVPERALRMLYLDDRFAGTRRDHSHLSVRAGVLPDRLHLDLRSTPTPAGAPPGTPDTGYLGIALEGDVRRLKVLALTDPTAGAAAFSADGLRLGLTAARTGKSLDVRRNGDDVALDTVGGLAAEVSVRDPRGLDTGAQPFKLVKAALRLPAGIGVSTAAAAFVPGADAVPLRFGRGVASVGSTDTLLLATGGVTFLPSWVGASVRYRSGALAGQRRRITSVAVDRLSLRTDPFPSAPTTGDPYVIEQGTGLTVETEPRGSVRGLSGRLALSKDLGEGTVSTVAVDRLLATRATPQVRLLDRSGLRSATGRFLGVTDIHVTPIDGGPLNVHLALDPGRVNPAFRALMRTVDGAPATERDLLKARVSTVPADVLVAADTSHAVFETRMATTAGEGAVWAEPGLVRDALAGARAGTAAGVGLMEASFDGLPRAARVTLIGGTAPGVASPVPGDLVPHNWTPPAGWVTTGFKIELSDTLDLHFVRSITWSADRPFQSGDVGFGTGVILDPDGLISLWGRIDATMLTVTHEMPAAAGDPPTLAPLILWMPGERPPADPSKAGGGLGFLVGTDLLVTVDANIYQKRALGPLNRWDGIGDALGNWYLVQELQMQSYRGEVTISTPLGLSTAGDMNAGPGQWFLRSLDSLPWYAGFGSVYFGNTGGTFFTRPRIFS